VYPKQQRHPSDASRKRTDMTISTGTHEIILELAQVPGRDLPGDLKWKEGDSAATEKAMALLTDAEMRDLQVAKTKVTDKILQVAQYKQLTELQQQQQPQQQRKHVVAFVVVQVGHRFMHEEATEARVAVALKHKAASKRRDREAGEQNDEKELES
jgi:hypothetical protein